MARLRKFIQSRWKQRGPRAAAQLHLDSSLSERQACSPHCPDSYLCNCVPVREEQQRSWQRRCPPPTPRQETCSNRDSGVPGLLVHCQERRGCRFVSLTCMQDPKCCLSRVPLEVYSERGGASLLTCVTGLATIAPEHRSSSQECLDNGI